MLGTSPGWLIKCWFSRRAIRAKGALFVGTGERHTILREALKGARGDSIDWSG